MKKGLKLPHKTRILSSKNPVHVVIKTNLKISLQDYDSLKKLRELIKVIEQRYWIGFFQFSIQKNHIHFFLQASSAKIISDAIRDLSSKLALYWNRRLGRKGTFWADRFFSAVKGSAREIIRTIHYVATQRKYLSPYENSYSSIGQCENYPWNIPKNILNRIGVHRKDLPLTIQNLMKVIEDGTHPYCRTGKRKLVSKKSSSLQLKLF